MNTRVCPKYFVHDCRVANFTDIINTAAMFIKRAFKNSLKGKNNYRLCINDTHRENCALLHSVQEWLLGCFWLFSYVYTIN